MVARRLFLFLLVILPALSAHAETIFKKRSWDHAVGGYDVVAYHTVGKPLKGDDAFKTEYLGVTWIFSSQENLDLFKADPDTYRPQYGGYCAWAMSKGKKAPGAPTAWYIHEDKLYLNVSQGIKRRWLKDIEGFIAKADIEWAKL